MACVDQEDSCEPNGPRITRKRASMSTTKYQQYTSEIQQKSKTKKSATNDIKPKEKDNCAGCEENKDEKMIGCDGECNGWFHYSCLGLDVKSFKEPDEFFCYSCVQSMRNKLSQTQIINQNLCDEESKKLCLEQDEKHQAETSQLCEAMNSQRLQIAEKELEATRLKNELKRFKKIESDLEAARKEVNDLEQKNAKIMVRSIISDFFKTIGST